MSYVVEEILKSRKITDYLASRGHNPVGGEVNGKLRYLCPLHQERSPSFMVYKNADYENFYCYGCLQEDELIWTTKGVRAIRDIKVGDYVLNSQGQKETVLCRQDKIAPTLAICLGSYRDPLVLTPDHTSLVIRKDSALKAFRRLLYRPKQKDVVFRPDLAGRPVYQSPSIKSVPTSTLKEGDYFIFPRITNRYTPRFISSPLVIKDYTKGPKVCRIESIPMSEDVAWFLGLYLAEGSISGNRVVNFTLNIGERDYAARILRTLKSVFGIRGRVKKRIKRNTLDVYCCNADLASHLLNLLGKGSSNKTIPGEWLWWDECYQKALLTGYQCGDGSKKTGTVTTTSKNLATAIFGLAVQARWHPSYYSPSVAHTGADGVFHQESYSVGFRGKDSNNGFYEKIAGVEYYVMPIVSIFQRGEMRVVDISVSGNETFCCKMAATHNCRAKYNVIHLYRDMEKVTIGEAIRALADGLELNLNSEIDHVIREIEDDNSIAHQFSPVDLSLIISRQVYDFTHMVDRNEADSARADKIYALLDESVDLCDMTTLSKLYEDLPDVLIARKRIYDDEKEARMCRATR